MGRQKDNYIWKNGFWTDKRPGFIFLPGYWKEISNGWTWISGAWKEISLETWQKFTLEKLVHELCGN